METLKAKFIVFLGFIATLNAFSAPAYPPEWWEKIPEEKRQSWEILPQDAGPGEVILSKRTELGIFSNLSASDIYYEGVSYASVEAFWQMMKYPEEGDRNDPRYQSTMWPYKRSQVMRLSGFDCKDAGDMANKINAKLGIKWISYKGTRFDYKDNDIGSQLHYHHVFRVIEAKVRQNPDIQRLLLKTEGLKLRPDHVIAPDNPPAYRYHEILMEIRARLILEQPK